MSFFSLSSFIFWSNQVNRKKYRKERKEINCIACAWNQHGSITTSQQYSTKKNPFRIDELITLKKKKKQCRNLLSISFCSNVHLTWIDLFFYIHCTCHWSQSRKPPHRTARLQTQALIHLHIFIRRNSHFQIGLIHIDWIRFFFNFRIFFAIFFCCFSLFLFKWLPIVCYKRIIPFEYFLWETYTVLCINELIPDSLWKCWIFYLFLYILFTTTVERKCFKYYDIAVSEFYFEKMSEYFVFFLTHFKK